MNRYKVGDIVEDKNGRTGLVISVYASPLATYYNILIDGEMFQLQAEDLV